MSLILEALRKSEAERQVGRAPGLLTPVPYAPMGRAPRRAPWVVLAVLLVGAALVLAWWLGRSAADGDVLPPAAAPATGTGPADALATPVATPPPTSASPSPTLASEPSAMPAPRPAPPVAGTADYPSDPDFPSTERESLPLPAPTPAPTPARETTPPEAAQADIPLPGDADWVMSLRQMTEADRAGLPPLRLNMHVFNDDPARRFVIVDGRRHAEGETLADGVRLAEIRRDGAVLDLRGRRVLLERP